MRDRRRAPGPLRAKLDTAADGAADADGRARAISQTSIRDVARETGFSLAGMYYYFENKEDLLFQIQHRTFAFPAGGSRNSVLAEERGPGRRSCAGWSATTSTYFTQPLQRAEGLHLRDWNRSGTSATARSTTSAAATSTAWRPCVGELMADRDGAEPDPLAVRHSTLFVFGMLNWIFMWFDPEAGRARRERWATRWSRWSLARA